MSVNCECMCVEEPPHCVQCLRKGDLIVLPNRKNGKFVGQTFVCKMCAQSLQGLEIDATGTFKKTIMAA